MSVDNNMRSMSPLVGTYTNSADAQIVAPVNATSIEAAENPGSNRPSIFSRIWNSEAVKSIFSGALYAGLAVGFAALWVFLPIIALPVTIAALSAVAGRIAGRLTDAIV